MTKVVQLDGRTSLYFEDADGDEVYFELLSPEQEAIIHITLAPDSRGGGTYLNKDQARELFNWLGVQLHKQGDA